MSLFLPNRASRVIKVNKGLQVKLFFEGQKFYPILLLKFLTALRWINFQEVIIVSLIKEGLHSNYSTLQTIKFWCYRCDVMTRFAKLMV